MRLVHIFIIAAMLLATAATVRADDGAPRDQHRYTPAAESNPESTFGIGAALGNPTGLMLEWMPSEHVVVNLGFGFGFYDDYYRQSHLVITLDFLWLFRITESDDGHLNFRFGAGPKLGFFYNDRAADLGFRVPIGIDWRFHHSPIDLFLEVAPGMWFTRHARFNIEALVAITFWL